ncbi:MULTISPECIES: PAS domain-containing protein [Massilia]|uniref:hybrid sensor histidine kinase/response regulator n=1 Tax=Massilia TaxID=149698 RepID=UPI001C6360ED|nr:MULTISPECIES: PAS domain-containing protein [Massilia]QYG03755.1 PAS domain-containing protein [Massilia sp. NP310]
MKQEPATPSEWLPFLSGGGMMGAMMRAHDWSASPLGSPRQWPQALRTVVGLMLNSKFPMFVAWGGELGFLYNDSYISILGDKHPTSLGKRFHDVWAEIWHDIHPLIVRALRGEASYMDRLPLRMRRHGYDEDTWFRFSYSPVRDEDGTVAGMFCACVEMTGEVLAQRYREEENERLVTLFEQAPGIIAVLRGPDHVFEITNRSYLQLVGHRALVGKAVRDALPEVQGQGFFELLDHVYRTGQPFVGHAVPLRVQRDPNAPLEERFIDFVYQPIHDQHGKVSGIFVEGSDVTARKRIEDELRAANRQKDQFLAMLAHELRNPLAPITTAAQLLQRGQMDAPGIQRASDIIARQAQHMTSLVNDLLDVSRVTRGLVTISKEALEMREIVHEAVEQVRPLIDARGHALQCEIAASPLRVEGDRTRLIQVVSNILNNAAKYTAAGGSLVLSARIESGLVRVAVRDNGQGIDPPILPYIFDLFIQAERTPDRSQGGLGLGLALVKSLAVLHGGRVEAHSAGLGKGSEFVVYLPCLAEAPEVSPPPLDVQPRGARGLRVLVVDDNVDAAQMLATLLEMNGYEVSIAYDGKGALASAVQAPPDVALLDIGLPDIDGHELARRLRAMPETTQAVLVALTGYGQVEDQRRAYKAGFDHHMAKPADLAKLLELLAGVA